jgi:hypothetical protein
MIWDRNIILRTLFPTRAAATPVARRWRAAAAKDRALPADMIRMGGVLTLQPVRLVDGFPEVEPLDPLRLAYEAGRRDFAMQILALMDLSIDDMNTLMEDNDV